MQTAANAHYQGSGISLVTGCICGLAEAASKQAQSAPRTELGTLDLVNLIDQGTQEGMRDIDTVCKAELPA